MTMSAELPAASGTSSRAIHALLVPFPIAFFVIALLSDIAFSSTGIGGFAAASLWLIGAGLISAMLAGIAGVFDFVYSHRPLRLNDVRFHAAATVGLVILQCLNFFLRQADPATGILPQGLLLSVLSVLLMLVIGWMGRRLAPERREASEGRLS
jgi:uncharacterized membrane protein